MRNILSFVLDKHKGEDLTPELCSTMVYEFETLSQRKNLLLNTDAKVIVDSLIQLANDVMENPEAVEENLLSLPQTECAVIHRFSPGLYIRELHMKAGTMAVGHHQKNEHFNMMIEGRLLMVENGIIKEVVAPLQFTGNPGRKVGYILEDVIWQNIYPNPTNETDIEKLEQMFVEKSSTWNNCESKRFAIKYATHIMDREDFALVLTEFGIPLEVANEQTNNEADQIPMPKGIESIHIQKSPINGSGLFTTKSIVSGEVIAPARINGMRTPAGRYTNHSITPNAEMVLRDNGDIDLVAIDDIHGCLGGGSGTEITISYRKTLALHGIKPLGVDL